MPRPYTPLALANYFIQRHGEDGRLEHMKLQKLVYCSLGWWLTDPPQGPDLLRELPQVWEHGPVFPSLYRVLKPFGRTYIEAPQSARPFTPPPAIEEADQDAHALLDWIWGRYGHLSGYALSAMTHKPGTAWRLLAEQHDFEVPENLAIPSEMIRAEFEAIVEAESNSTNRQEVA
jgi:uncharacterized phage-associated protein